MFLLESLLIDVDPPNDSRGDTVGDHPLFLALRSIVGDSDPAEAEAVDRGTAGFDCDNILGLLLLPSGLDEAGVMAGGGMLLTLDERIVVLRLNLYLSCSLPPPLPPEASPLPLWFEERSP